MWKLENLTCYNECRFSTHMLGKRVNNVFFSFNPITKKNRQDLYPLKGYSFEQEKLYMVSESSSAFSVVANTHEIVIRIIPSIIFAVAQSLCIQKIGCQLNNKNPSIKSSWKTATREMCDLNGFDCFFFCVSRLPQIRHKNATFSLFSFIISSLNCDQYPIASKHLCFKCRTDPYR